MSTALDDLFVKVRAEKRAALIAYIPAGFPTKTDCHRVIQAFIDGGVDAIEIGFPYSDPVMDGPTIQAAAVTALNNGTGAEDVLDALEVATKAGIPSVVMTYWNPIEKYGVEKFASAIKSHGGSGVIHPDITIEESSGWLAAASSQGINPNFNRIYSTIDKGLNNAVAICLGWKACWDISNQRRAFFCTNLYK